MTKKILISCMLAASLTGCASYGQPPKAAHEMWKPTPAAKTDVNTALKQCDFVDRLSAGPEKIQEQARCMREMGFSPDFSSYSAGNCYGDAPAACIVYWPQGLAKPQVVKPQTAAPDN